MTAAAIIPQAETERLLKAARSAGWSHVSLRLDLDRRVINATFSDSPPPEPAPATFGTPGGDGWDDEDN